MDTSRAAIAGIILAVLGMHGAEGAIDGNAGPALGLAAAYDHEIRPLLNRYCTECHGASKHKADVDFSALTQGGVAIERRALWRSVAKQVGGGDMPPAGAKAPGRQERSTVLAWLGAIKRLEPPDPGPAVMRRLARAEYANTVSDLFGVDLHAGGGLPADNPGIGFDNSVSPALMESYLTTADEILERIIVPDQLHLMIQAGQLDATVAGKVDPGKPDGKERVFRATGDLGLQLTVPVDGSYAIRVRASGEQAGGEPVRLAIRFDDQVVGEMRVTAKPGHPSTYSLIAKLRSGRTRLSIIFVNPMTETIADATPAMQKGAQGQRAPARTPSGLQRAAMIEQVEIIGPPAKGAGDAQRRLIIATPGKDLGRRAAARTILEPFALRAFRRPPETAEIEALLTVFDLADSQDEVFSASVALMIKAVLISPQFLYRSADGPASSSQTTVPVGDYELASRLSYLLWSTMPDDELMSLARAGKLNDAGIIAQQAQRLIADPRSRALSVTFAAPWLELDRIATTAIDKKRFPDVTPELRQAMYDEGVMFFDRLLRDQGSVLDLIDCDYAFVNARTARLYGIESTSATMQRVTLSDANRGGVLAMPGILLATSQPDRTSPVKRGKWVLQKLLGSEPPPPPPDVPALSKQDSPGHETLSLRQKTERHRTDPACAGCHRVIDPIGFGLENFDVTGRWRELDGNGIAIDAVGELPGGIHFSSPADLKKIMMGRKDEFVHAFIGTLLAFTLGRPLTAYDEVVVDDLAERAAKDAYRLDRIVVGIVTSYPFRNRRSAP